MINVYVNNNMSLCCNYLGTKLPARQFGNVLYVVASQSVSYLHYNCSFTQRIDEKTLKLSTMHVKKFIPIDYKFKNAINIILNEPFVRIDDFEIESEFCAIYDHKKMYKENEMQVGDHLEFLQYCATFESIQAGSAASEILLICNKCEKKEKLPGGLTYIFVS